MLKGITCFIGLGSNINDRLAWLTRGTVRIITAPGITLKAVSAVYESLPINMTPETDNFYNAVILIETQLPPRLLLRVLHSIEEECGRDRKKEITSYRPISRTLDLDLLTYNNRWIEEDDLFVPHPEIPYRRFVLKPMCDINENFIHPLLGTKIKELDTFLYKKTGEELKPVLSASDWQEKITKESPN